MVLEKRNIIAKYVGQELNVVDDGEFLHIMSTSVIADWGDMDGVIGSVVYFLREEERICELIDFIWPVGSDGGEYYRSVLCHKMLFYLGYYDLEPLLFPFYSASESGRWFFPWARHILPDGIDHVQLVNQGSAVYDHDNWVLAGNPTFPPVQTSSVLIDEADEEVSVFLKNHYNIDLIIPHDIQEKMDFLLDILSSNPEHEDIRSYMNRFSALVMKFVADMKNKGRDIELGVNFSDWEEQILKYANMKRSMYATYDLKTIGGDRRMKLMLALSAIAPNMREVRWVDCVFFLRIMGGLLKKEYVTTTEYVYYPCEKYGIIVEVTANRDVIPRRRYIRACEQLCAIRVDVLLEDACQVVDEVADMVSDLASIIPVVFYSETQNKVSESVAIKRIREKVKKRFTVVDGQPPPWVGVVVTDYQSLLDTYYYYYREWKRDKLPSAYFYSGENVDLEWARQQVMDDISAAIGDVIVSSETIVSNGGISFYQRKVRTRYGEYVRMARTSSRLRALIEGDFDIPINIEWD
jgi:hypothetical protein